MKKSAASADSKKGAPSAMAELQQLHLSHGGEEEGIFSCFVGALARKKPLDCRTVTHLNRCLGLVDLTALGVGSTLGLGLYVLAGQVASIKAGPAVLISFGLAALASAFSALCYAEFAGRIPQAGSAYAYSYITVGELAAFVIGWNLVLEYVIGASTVARGFSSYLRSVTAQLLSSPNENKSNQAYNGTSMMTSPPAEQPTLTPQSTEVDGLFGEILHYVTQYFDGLSILIVLAVTVLLICGVKGSTKATLTFTLINLSVVVVFIASSLSYMDINYWHIDKSQVPPGHGEGGFMPFGWSGVLAGSATCFFGFIGFDTIASSAEEARSPKRNVPISILLSLAISTAVYMTVATVQTLIWPYYDQDKVTVLPYIFEKLDLPFTYWVISLGAIAGLASSQLGSMIPLPRILYSMAQDRLIYQPLAKVEPSSKTPVRATIIGNILVAALACLFDIDALTDMVSIGTLAAYSIVSLSVLILRYQKSGKQVDDSTIVSGRLSLSDIVAANAQESSVRQLRDQRAEPLDRERAKLGPKESTPIRVKGSRSLNPQLSVGFQSWFRPKVEEAVAAEEERAQVPAAGPDSPATATGGWQRFLCLGQSNQTVPDDASGKQSRILITMIVLIALALGIVGKRLLDLNGGASGEKLIDEIACEVTQLAWVAFILAALLSAVMLILARLPVEAATDANMFRVPFVPLVPTLSILVNIFLMLNLSYITWIRFTVWMSVGMFIYFTYGIFNSQGYLLHLYK